MDALPPFDKCNYTSVPYSQLPSPTFLAIYNLIVARSCASRPDRGVQNLKGMDRAVRHFEAGDVQDIQISQVQYTAESLVTINKHNSLFPEITSRLQNQSVSFHSSDQI